ncbi:hypothetical protein NW762_008854 [Fusarium torreyae]|uniref:Uncharacterized protein n=1 Tax=Fusarium torreyae TaxID=1237075 RepID=A0A9W8VCB0_9HYPO|nr:hypothetical protein NW762_008854 [Fusarium torreyae]
MEHHSILAYRLRRDLVQKHLRDKFNDQDAQPTTKDENDHPITEASVPTTAIPEATSSILSISSQITALISIVKQQASIRGIWPFDPIAKSFLYILRHRFSMDLFISGLEYTYFLGGFCSSTSSAYSFQHLPA